MDELSVFVDESGNIGTDSVYYCVALVLHEQRESLSTYTAPYLQSLANASLADIPFHLTPLIRAHADYEHLPLETRKRYLSMFRVLAEHVPFRYGAFCYRKAAVGDRDALQQRMARDIELWLKEHLSFFQRFDWVKIYYDDGQRIVTDAVHRSFERMLSNDAIVYKDAIPNRFRLLQLADFVCGIEVLAEKYNHHQQTSSDVMFFGQKNAFQKNYLKKVRKHLL